MPRSAIGWWVGGGGPSTSHMAFKLLWRKVRFVGLIAVPGRNTFDEKCTLIKYSLHNNSQTETFR